MVLYTTSDPNVWIQVSEWCQMSLNERLIQVYWLKTSCTQLIGLSSNECEMFTDKTLNRQMSIILQVHRRIRNEMGTDLIERIARTNKDWVLLPTQEVENRFHRYHSFWSDSLVFAKQCDSQQNHHKKDDKAWQKE